jgi:hypothetical protein
LKTIDFDFWSSNYGITPTPEYHRYFQLVPDQTGQLKQGIKYYVRSGQIQIESGTINQKTINQGNVFICLSSSSFKDLLLNGRPAVVAPAVFTRLGYVTAANWGSDPIYNYGTQIPAEQDLDSFDGFYGIQSLSPEEIIDPNIKSTLFEYGKLDTEYQYLQENYTITRANKSRIVPYINKWTYNGGTDSLEEMHIDLTLVRHLPLLTSLPDSNRTNQILNILLTSGCFWKVFLDNSHHLQSQIRTAIFPTKWI